jgi:hypothetical protein
LDLSKREWIKFGCNLFGVLSGSYEYEVIWLAVFHKVEIGKLYSGVGVSTPGGVPGPTSEIVAACPSPDGLARDGTQRGENRGSCYPAPEWVRLQ